MANQSPDRRAVLELMAKVAVASQFPGFSRWVSAASAGEDAQAGPAQPSHIKGRPYRPQFFTPDQFEAADVLSERIIPADESPGAHAAGVVEFIDFMAARDTGIQEPLRTGLRALDRSAHTLHGTTFVKLSEPQQIAMLERGIGTGSRRAEEVENVRFLALFRKYTVMGYYTSRIGLKELDYPGLRMYSQSPACPHTDDREHKHLPPPRI